MGIPHAFISLVAMCAMLSEKKMENGIEIVRLCLIYVPLVKEKQQYGVTAAHARKIEAMRSSFQKYIYVTSILPILIE